MYRMSINLQFGVLTRKRCWAFRARGAVVSLGAVIMLCGLFSGVPAFAESPKVHGLELVPWSKKLETDRYRSARDWEGTLKHFRDTFRGWRGIRWHREVNLPTVKYIHIENQNERSGWRGVNIYQLPNGQVRMYVLQRVVDDAPAVDAPQTP